MNVQKVIIALACVLAATVAALPAKAQGITHAERETYRIMWEKSQQSRKRIHAAKPAEPADTLRAVRPVQADTIPTVTPKTSAPLTMGREMRIVSSSEYTLEVLGLLGRSAKEAFAKAAVRQVKYGPAGREGKIMQMGDFLFSKQAPRSDTTNAQRDSLTRALETAAVKAAKAAREDSLKNKTVSGSSSAEQRPQITK